MSLTRLVSLGASLALFASCAFADSLPADKLAPSFLGKYAERTKIVRTPGAVEIDAKAALKEGLQKCVLVSPDIGGGPLAGKEAYFEITASGSRAKLDVYFEGRTEKGRHFYTFKTVRLSRVPRTYALVRKIAPDIRSLHLRVDIVEQPSEPVKITGLEWGLDDGSHYTKSARTWKEPELVFHAPMDGSAEAALAKGAKAPVTAKGLSFVPGVKGQALRMTAKAKSLLEYAAPGNLDRHEGSVAMWVKTEWPDEGGQLGGKEIWRFLFGSGFPFCSKARPGSGATYLWFWGPGIRTDRSDLDGGTIHRIDNRLHDGEWHHLVFSWSDESIALFVDGKSLSGGLSDAYSPLKAALTDPSVFAYSHFEDGPKFSIGCESGARQFDGLIDDVRIYSAPFGFEEAHVLYLREAPEKPQPERPYVFEGEPVSGVPPYGVLTKENPVEGTEPAAVAGTIPADDLELVDRVTFDARPAASRFRSHGEMTFGEIGGRKYLEAGDRPGSRFAVGFAVDTNAPLYVVDIDYPDDKVRTMDVIVQNALRRGGDYTMQCGVATGHEYPNTGRFLTHRCLFWSRTPSIAVVCTTSRQGQRAAAREIRLYRVKSGRLPPAKMNEPAANGGWRRTLALYFEDPAINYDFAVDQDGYSARGVNDLVDRTAALMKFTGENLFAYPGSWYQGLIGERYNPRRHAPKFLDAFYAKFDREGLGVMPTFNKNNMPVPSSLVTPKSFVDGTLHESVIAIHSSGRPNPGGWHGSPPNFNIFHPDVQKHILSEVDALVAQGRGHPSFRGICFHLTRHCMLWWGDPESGYNDYAVKAFGKAAGVEIPIDPKDPLRGKASAEWIRANAWEKWLDWRCDVVTAFYAEVARRLRAARPDLKLWVNSQIMMNTSVAGIRDADYTIRNDRWAGLDAAKLNAAIPNLMLGETFEPADYRFRGRERFDSDADYEAQRQQYGKRESWDLIRGAAYPVAGQHDRYFESAMGRDSENLSCDWLQECTWRVSTINPPDFHALEHFVKPLRHQDVLGMSKGGFLIGTYGMERHLAAFAQAFRALPAVTMRDVGERDGVVVRQADFDGRSYFYVVNTEASPRTVAIGLPPASTDLVSGKALVGGSRDTRVTLALKPYELRSFVAPCGKPRFE